MRAKILYFVIDSTYKQYFLHELGMIHFIMLNIQNPTSLVGHIFKFKLV